MITRASGLGMGVGMSSRPLRAVGMIAILDVGLDTPGPVAVAPGAGVLRLLVPGMAVGVFIGRLCVADGVEVTR